MAKLARCRFCQARVEFFASPFTGRVRKFDARPVDGRSHTGAAAYPVMGKRAYKHAELASVLRVQRECSLEDAENEVYDMPWYVPHDCPNSPFNSADHAPSERTRQ